LSEPSEIVFEVAYPDDEFLVGENFAEFAERLADGVIAGRIPYIANAIETLCRMLASVIAG
jgi:hypothetical protein